MSDLIHRFLLENLNVRGEWVKLSKSWKDIQKTSDYPPAVCRVLGEAVAAISLFADTMKFNGSIILQTNDTYPVTMMVVQATCDGQLRAMARWEGELNDDALFSELFGEGTLAITLEPDGEGERYQSLIALEPDSLSSTLSHYFQQSEQLSTEVWLYANQETAVGLLLQNLPSEESNTANWNHAVTLARTISDEELLDLNVIDLLHRLYHNEDCRLFDANSLKFECSCSVDKIHTMILSLGKSEVDSIIKEHETVEVTCEFCNQKYSLDSIDVEKLFTKSLQPGSDKIH